MDSNKGMNLLQPQASHVSGTTAIIAPQRSTETEAAPSDEKTQLLQQINQVEEEEK